ncbi:hypothetical protein [Arthrobacter caoxuetaonis]|uniref:Uncharacterized protein n=1 Tax=Arthrobacter caoxuetaonis TaxID=2886935 RepID=A0A9X1MGP1_9MICC|nr:hypothetical protein [Arthrobacter caoxuetaonis]MCC3299754.1 hypothetical protein [Arthrobacter caoxuetaonis]USQ59344.1 hypothetical protein NF551_17325 [Arthrobacter caoxuetaonis]
MRRRSSWIIRYGSEMLTHRQARRRARSLLHRGIEPEPRYRTGKYWND